MDPVSIGVSITLEAHRRGLLADERLQAVLDYYDGPGAERPTSPAAVLERIGGVPMQKVLELIELTPLPTGHRRFNDRLTTHEVLGSGGMGVVYKGFDRLLKRVVALKVLNLDQVSSDRRRLLLGRFEREARVMARLRHPAIAQLHDAGLNEQGNPYLAMELVPGQNLDRVIEIAAPEGLDVRRVLRWGVTVAEALHACHTAGVIHRDVKPSNVIVTPSDEARLVDFGVAIDELAATRLTAENAQVGTALYMAPEQITGQTCDARSDVYALGGTLFHALAGRPAFDAPHVVLLLDVVGRQPAPRLRTLRPDVPPRVDDLIRRCLEKAPEARPSSAAALAAALQEALDERPAAPRRSAAPRALGGALLASAVAAAIGGAAAQLGSSARSTPAAPATSASLPVGDRKARAVDRAPRPEPEQGDPGSPPAPLPPGIEVGAAPGEYVNAKDGSILVYVPPGAFLMGQPEAASDPAEPLLEVKWNDRPAHRVRLSGYFIGKYEVTSAQYARFAAEQPAFALPLGDFDASGARDDRPVVGVTWEQARAYAEWAGLSLPTEAQWEYAARGPREEHSYPWGAADLTPGAANLFGDRDGEPGVAPVGSFPKDVSPFNCHDMCGNVSEWVSDFYGPYSPEEASDPRGPRAWTMSYEVLVGWREARAGEGPLRAVRGGSWHSWDGRVPAVDFYSPGTYYYQVTRRYAGHQSAASSRVLGFRVSRGLGL